MRGKEGKKRGSRDGGKEARKGKELYKMKTMEERQKQDKEAHSI